MTAENKNTQIIATYEAFNMEKAIEEKSKCHDEKDTFLTCCIQKETAEYVYDLIDKDFDDNLNDFDRLIKICDRAKDLGYFEMAGDQLMFIKEHHSAAYQNYLLEGKSDYSSADGKEV